MAVAFRPRDVQERYIETRVVAYAKKLGWFSRKLQWIGRHGAPDRFFARKGKIIMIEFKQWKKKPTENQQREIDALRDQGVEVYVIDHIEAGIELFDRLTAAQANYEDKYDWL